jgi:hypothetical protein
MLSTAAAEDAITASADATTPASSSAPTAARLGLVGFGGGGVALVVWLAVLLVALWALTHLDPGIGPVRYVQSLA